MRRLRFILAAIVAASVPAAPAAQQTFRSTSNIVAVDVTVYDKDGQPVTDLGLNDFQIFEGGVAQPLQTIYLVTPGAGARPMAPAESGAPNAAAPPPSAPAASPLRREQRARVLIFVFDLNHLSVDGYKRSRAAVESFIKDGALPTDMIGVVVDSTMLTNKISTDTAPILEAMKTMKGPKPGGLQDLRAYPTIPTASEALAVARNDQQVTDRLVRRACNEQPDDCRNGDEPVRQQIQAKSRQFASEANRDSALTLATLGTLANGLGRFPGSKQVLLLSDGFNTEEFGTQLKSVVQISARNNVRFSTLDSRGLNRDPRMSSMMGAQPIAGTEGPATLSFDQDGDALASLAIDTGGEMVQNRNDLRPGIDMIARTSGTYYVIGYSPLKALDGGYRPIAVKVTRPGVTIRARKGYIAASGSGPGGVGTPAAPVPPSATPVTPARPDALPVPSAPSMPIVALAGNAAASVPAGAAPGAAPSIDTAPRARPNSEKNVSSLRPASGADGEGARLADAGWAAYSAGDVAAARDKLAAAIASGGQAPWVSYALGFSEYALGHYEAAERAWTTVRAAVPEFMPVYFDIADAEISLGRAADSLTVLRDAARRWPAEPEAQNALGTMLVKRGALDEAIDVLERITTARPADGLGFFNLGRARHLRYLRLQQNVSSTGLRGANAIGEEDRKAAIAAYKRYLELGGPFEKQARDAIAVLDWK